MLSIGKLRAGREAYYLNGLAAGVKDYYLAGDAEPGRWIGASATVVGLANRDVSTVTPDALRAVLGGRHPLTAEPLVAHPDAPGRIPGFDLTFSAPKSVSVLWGLADTGTASLVTGAHRHAIGEALAYLEADAVRARRGHAGADQLPTDGVLAAAFEHRTSRAGDPQLHTHVLMANMVRGDDGRWSALYSQRLYTHAKTAGYVYQAALRAALTETLGVTWGPIRNGVAELDGVSAEQRTLFSRRRAEIAAELERLGMTTPPAARVATLTTRAAKEHSVSLTDLRRAWAERARQAGLSLDGLDLGIGHGRPATLDFAVIGELLEPTGLPAGRSSFDSSRRHPGLGRLMAHGLLVGPEHTAGGLSFAVNDVVLCLRNDRRLGVRNGTTGTLIAIGDQEAVIRTPDGIDVTLPVGYLAAGHLTHGYATTVHKSQGATVDRAFVLGSDQLYREAGYVALSRARARSDLYMVGPEIDGPTMGDLGALADLRRRLTVSRAQLLALDQLDPGGWPAPGEPLDGRRPEVDGDRRPPTDPGVSPPGREGSGAFHRLQARALLADPPAYLVAAIGPPPLAGPDRRRWVGDAVRIASYRYTYGITDPHQALGAEPSDARQHRAWELARLTISHRQKTLDQDLGIQR